MRALLARARADELAILDGVPSGQGDQLADVTERVWSWLVRPEHRALLALWVEAYARSVVDPDGPWSGSAEGTVAERASG